MFNKGYKLIESIDGNRYNAFPHLFRKKDGRVVLNYHRFKTHIGEGTLWETYTDDYETWKEPYQVKQKEDGARIGEMFYSYDGNEIIRVWTELKPLPTKIFYEISKDNGNTYDQLNSIQHNRYTYRTISPMIKYRDKYYIGLYGRKTKSSTVSSTVMCSSDLINWCLMIENESYDEVFLGVFNDKLIRLVRNSFLSKIYYSELLPSNKWSPLIKTNIETTNVGRPNFLVDSGSIIIASRNRNTVDIWKSNDGINFNQIEHSKFSSNNEYCDIVTTPNNYLMAYGHDVSKLKSDIYVTNEVRKPKPRLLKTFGFQRLQIERNIDFKIQAEIEKNTRTIIKYDYQNSSSYIYRLFRYLSGEIGLDIKTLAGLRRLKTNEIYLGLTNIEVKYENNELTLTVNDSEIKKISLTEDVIFSNFDDNQFFFLGRSAQIPYIPFIIHSVNIGEDFIDFSYGLGFNNSNKRFSGSNDYLLIEK